MANSKTNKPKNEDELADILASLDDADTSATIDDELRDILDSIDDGDKKEKKTSAKVKSKGFDSKSKAEKKEEVSDVIDKIVNDEVEITEESANEILSMLEGSGYLDDESEDAKSAEVKESKPKKSSTKKADTDKAKKAAPKKELDVEAEFKKAEKAYDKEDYKTAFECYTRLADYGHNQGKNRLAGLYATGKGVELAFVSIV
ncbi:MAG: hypothetical protein IJB98_00350 [Clostridia bacterium]|nr:hypothetical protein [Clostridia bacterium]